MEENTINVSVGYAPEATAENAGAIRTALLMGFIQLSQQYLSTAIEPEVARIAGQYLPVEIPQVASLEGLREALLAPRVLARNEDGCLFHDAIPVLDEGTNVKTFLEAFGLEVHIGSMESDMPEFSERWHAEGLHDLSEWDPVRPKGDGWVLLEIYQGEDDNWALFVRCANTAKKERDAAERAARLEARRVEAGERRDSAALDELDTEDIAERRPG